MLLKALIAKFSYRRVKCFWIGLSILLLIAFVTCLVFTIKTYNDFNTWKTVNLFRSSSDRLLKLFYTVDKSMM
jgi:hypothetical protein